MSEDDDDDMEIIYEPGPATFYFPQDGLVLQKEDLFKLDNGLKLNFDVPEDEPRILSIPSSLQVIDKSRNIVTNGRDFVLNGFVKNEGTDDGSFTTNLSAYEEDEDDDNDEGVDIDITKLSQESNGMIDKCWEYYDFNTDQIDIKGIEDDDEDEEEVKEDEKEKREEYGKRDRCKICSRSFETVMKLRTHLQDVHHQFKCPYCDREITHRSNLYRHVRTAHKDFVKVINGNSDLNRVCQVCFKKFADKEALDNHLRGIHDDITMMPNKSTEVEVSPPPRSEEVVEVYEYKCPKCDRKLKTEKILRRHLASIHNSLGPRIECKICRKFYSGPEVLQTHQEKFHKLKSLVTAATVNVNDDENNPFPCPQCDKKLKTPKLLGMHLQTAHGFSNDSLSEDVGTEEEEETEDEEDQKCPQCNKVLKTTKILRTHIKNVHGSPPPPPQMRSEETRFQCPYCEKTPKSRKMFRQHLRRVHRVLSHAALDNLDPTTTTSNGTKVTTITNNNHPNFKCKRCGKLLKTRKILRSHLRRVHKLKLKKIIPKVSEEEEEEEDHQSEDDEDFYDDDLLLHETLKCHKCETVVKSRSVLRRHVIRVHGSSLEENEVRFNSPPPISRKALLLEDCCKCPLCDRVLKTDKYLKEHIMIVHEGYRPFLCRYCNTRFSKTNHLRSHIERSHAGEVVKIIKSPIKKSTTTIIEESRKDDDENGDFWGFHPSSVIEALEHKKQLQKVIMDLDDNGLRFLV